MKFETWISKSPFSIFLQLKTTLEEPYDILYLQKHFQNHWNRFFLKSCFLADREVDFQNVINNNFLRILVDPENCIGMPPVGSWQDSEYMLSTSLAKISFIIWILEFKVLQKAVFVTFLFKQT